MSASERLTDHLREQHVPFETQEHRVAYTAQAVAASEHVSGDLVAKVVMVVADEEPVMLVLPAPHHVDLERAAELLGASHVRLAAEAEFAPLFPDCDVGAMPPFGTLYGVPAAVDRHLADDETIVCQAGTHTDTISLRYADFERVVRPRIGDLCTRR